MDPLNISAKFDVRSFTHSWDNRGYFKNLGSPWIRTRSLFSQIFKGLLFALTLRIYLPSLKFIALTVPEIIWGTQKKLGSPSIRPGSLFSQIFYGLVLGWTLWMYRPNLQYVALAVPETIVIAVLGWGCKPPIFGKGRPFERALVTSYRLSIVTFPLSLRVSDILPLLFSSTPPHP